MTAKVKDSPLNTCLEFGISLLIVATITVAAIGIFSLINGYTFTEGVNHIYEHLNDQNAFEIICVDLGIFTVGLTMILHERRKSGWDKEKQKSKSLTEKDNQSVFFDKNYPAPPATPRSPTSSTDDDSVRSHNLSYSYGPESPSVCPWSPLSSPKPVSPSNPASSDSGSESHPLGSSYTPVAPLVRKNSYEESYYVPV